MRKEKEIFRIGELANNLSIERFVIRFWEKEFEIRAKRTPGGQRFYDENDLKYFATIKELLYQRKFTIAGAKEVLSKSKNIDIDSIIASQVTTIDQGPSKRKEIVSDKMIKQLKNLRKNLIKLQGSL